MVSGLAIIPWLGGFMYVKVSFTIFSTEASIAGEPDEAIILIELTVPLDKILISTFTTFRFKHKC